MTERTQRTSSFASERPASQSGVDDRRSDISLARAERDRVLTRLHALETFVERQTDLFARHERIARQSAAEVVALRTSTSWKVTRPLRFLSKCVSALRKGPAYWRHVYAVREQVRENWRRENPDDAATPAIEVAATPMLDVAIHGDSVQPLPDESSMAQVPIPARARAALRRAKTFASRI